MKNEELRKLSVAELVKVLEGECGEAVCDWLDWCGLEGKLQDFKLGEYSNLEEVAEECEWEL